MKKHIFSIGIILIGCVLLSDRVVAEASWWEKGASIFQSIGKENRAEIVQGPSLVEIAEAFKEALRIGSGSVSQKLGANDGFNADSAIHIPLPEELNSVKTLLTKVGMSQVVDDLELKLNRAAEVATPKAKDLFLQAIGEMTFEDVQKIYKGPENSATLYFQDKMTPALKKEMLPLVENSLSQVGVVQSYDAVIGQYKTLPFVPDVKADLTQHVLQKGLDGIFYYLAKEEAAIRQNPVQQTTELLKKVFGAVR